VAKLIYVGIHTRTDILLALSFLCSCVSSPTEQDKKKLRRLLEYLHGTKWLHITLGADSLTTFLTWVDASFTTRSDMRISTKQKINTKSSTEAGVIGASNYIAHTLYVKMFMKAQGYPIAHTIFYQENESAIKMEQNGLRPTITSY
jgi:hypothetical protein